jgi:YD repeat-containing protein
MREELSRSSAQCTGDAKTQVFTYSTVFPGNGTNWSSKSTSVTTTASGKSYLTQYSYQPYGLAQPVYTTSTVAAQIPLEYQIMTYDWGTTTSPLQTVTKYWADQFNMTRQDTTIGGVTSKVTYSPGSFLPTETDEYDFGASTATRKTLITYQPITAPGTILNEPCKTVITEGANTSEADSYYDGGGTLCGADSGGSTTAALSPLSANHDETNYGPTAASSVARGNLTKLVRVLAGGTAPTTTFTYDETGQVVSMTDPCGNATCPDMSGSTHTTSYSYTDSPPEGNPYGQSNAYLTAITRPSTNGVAHTESYQYNYASGELAQSTDENSETTTYSYADPLLRLTDVYGPQSAQNGVQPHTHYKYTDNTYVPDQPPTPGTVTTTGPSGIISVNVMDGVGNTVQTQLTTDPGGADYIDTTYDGLGRVQSVSNPYRTTGDLTYGLTSYLYDPLNRKKTQCQPDNSTTPSTACTPQSSYRSWSYSGNVITFTDENGNEWQRTIDGLGRMTQVQEPSAVSPNPTLTTNYSYDLLDNLLSVNQQGAGTDVARNRSFNYDSLSRLTCASNPESSYASCPATATSTYTPGTIGYTYDANGNLASKTDARGIVTTYTYDALNRLLSKSYALSSGGSAGTPSSCFLYDTAARGVGRLASEWTQDGSCPASAPSPGFFTLRSITGYDEMGRITNEQQCTPAHCAASSGPALGYNYDLAGKPTQTTNSVGAGTSALTTTNTFDLAGHLSSVGSNWGAFPTCLYVLGAANTNCTPGTASASYGYGPVGPLTWTHGSNLTVTQGYTNRLWVNSISATGQFPPMILQAHPVKGPPSN